MNHGWSDSQRQEHGGSSTTWVCSHAYANVHDRGWCFWLQEERKLYYLFFKGWHKALIKGLEKAFDASDSLRGHWAETKTSCLKSIYPSKLMLKHSSPVSSVRSETEGLCMQDKLTPKIIIDALTNRVNGKWQISTIKPWYDQADNWYLGWRRTHCRSERLTDGFLHATDKTFMMWFHNVVGRILFVRLQGTFPSGTEF